MSDQPKYMLQWTDGQTFGPNTVEGLVDWAREGRIPRDALLKPMDGGETISVFAVPQIAAAMDHIAPFQPVVATSAGSTLIPTTNPPALTGYYLAVFSIFPGIGVLLSIPAVICGIVGLHKVKANPQVKGTAHAWTAVVLGLLTTALWLGLIGFAVVAPLMAGP